MIGWDGYWKELDINRNICSICNKEEYGNNQGICYFFSNGLIDHISECENKKEVSLLYKFDEDIMTEYHDGVQQYVETYYGSGESGFFRYIGKEFDKRGNNVIYEGDFVNGKRNGYDVQYIAGKPFQRSEGINGIQKETWWILIYTYIVLEPLIALGFILFFFSEGNWFIVLYYSLVLSF